MGVLQTTFEFVETRYKKKKNTERTNREGVPNLEKRQNRRCSEKKRFENDPGSREMFL